MTAFDRYWPQTGVWEVTTERGTRQILDLDENIWMRVPGEHSATPYPTDRQWQRLAAFASGALGPDQFGEVWVGRPLRIWRTLDEWWTTTWVTAVREMFEDEVPPPSPIYLSSRTRGVLDGWSVRGGDIPAYGEGPSIEDAMDDYIQGLCDWLAEPGVLGSSRLARRWKADSEAAGSVRAHVAALLADDIARFEGREDE
ncbi:hypothetical protein [Nocardioides jejuensis]|uniref:Uncharacterized protein n=1 Tax=Nocardioides jejuensis TaxID=2502782 RepID=A0A4R1BUP6_9ACTN|nr:hypothetical protein [Nocardioides jejuensis]TCJ21649.1 hypothetical protein EPD65_14575 [Nocardioides jejuensis]